jgi:predicted DCC family thiol-disulfide oxidoreductase YuxK
VVDRHVLLFDEDCGFCRWSAERILRWDRAGRLRAAPIQGAEGRGLLADLSEDRRLASWHLIAPDGRRHAGGEAVAPLARLLPGGAPVRWVADTFPGSTRRLYGLVARHRGRLGALLGERACAVDPSQWPSRTSG